MLKWIAVAAVWALFAWYFGWSEVEAGLVAIGILVLYAKDVLTVKADEILHELRQMQRRDDD